MTTTLRIDDGLKRDCDAIFDDLGLSMAGAVTIFLKQVVKQRGIPFVITCDRQTSVGHLENTAVMLAERSRMARRYAAVSFFASYAQPRFGDGAGDERRLRGKGNPACVRRNTWRIRRGASSCTAET